MFISDDNSQNDIKKEQGMDSTLDESIDFRDDIGEDLKSEMELSDDSKLGDTPILSTLVPLEAGNVSSGMLIKNYIILYIWVWKTTLLSFSMAITQVFVIRLESSYCCPFASLLHHAFIVKSVTYYDKNTGWQILTYLIWKNYICNGHYYYNFWKKKQVVANLGKIYWTW